MRMFANKKGLSPVIASIILCSAVIVVGVSVWSFTYGVSSFLQKDYYEGVKEQIDKISERFTVENIAFNNVSGSLYMWMYNYGNITKYSDIDIEVSVSVSIDGEVLENVGSIPISSGQIVKITIPVGTLEPGSELVVKVSSRRENVVYQTYVVPVG